MKNLKKIIAIIAAFVLTLSIGALVACGNTEDAPTGPVVERISINTENVKKSFELGDTFTYDGLVVTAYYDDDTNKVLQKGEYTVTTPDLTTEGNKSVTVSFGGKTASYIVAVNDTRHKCTEKCPVCGNCLDSLCEDEACATKCGDDLKDEYQFEAEADEFTLVAGSRGALGKTAVKDDGGVPPEIKDKNKDIVYVSNFNANAGDRKSVV